MLFPGILLRKPVAPPTAGDYHRKPLAYVHWKLAHQVFNDFGIVSSPLLKAVLKKSQPNQDLTLQQITSHRLPRILRLDFYGTNVHTTIISADFLSHYSLLADLRDEQLNVVAISPTAKGFIALTSNNSGY